MDTKDFVKELIRCRRSPSYFINNYCQIENPQEGKWESFDLWPAQEEVTRCFKEQYLIALKARQLGMSWLFLAEQLYYGVMNPGTQHLIFSKRDEEAKDLLRRVKGMYQRLPFPFRNNLGRDGCAKFEKDDSHMLELDNGSRFKAFPTTGGDSYTAASVLVDEADLQPSLENLLRAVKPTVDNGGKLRLISRSNKDMPDSDFKKIYQGSKEGANSWKSIFLPWNVHPKRTQQWYNDQKQDSESRTGSLDFLYEHYPNSDTEALAARILNKRLPPQWFDPVFSQDEILVDIQVEVPGLIIWEYNPDDVYVLGVDVAEGNETSNDSAVVVLNAKGEQCGEFSGKIEISIFSEYVYAIAKFFNRAKILVERNNHGHAVIQRLKEKDPRPRLLFGKDAKVGWQTTAVSKAEMYTRVAELLRSQSIKIRSHRTKTQLMSVERATLKAPEGLLDDLAVAYAIACEALKHAHVESFYGVF